MKVMGIETSCDETAVAIVDDKKNIITNLVFSQMEHATYGGVVPELASRSHLLYLPKMIVTALKKSNLKFNDLDGLSCTTGPGLIGGLAVGLTVTKAISISAKKPFICINHLEGHALTPHLMGISYPYLLLLISGGHTQIVFVKNIGNYKIHAITIDDAAGEAFDKVAKMLGEPYPGGKQIEILASKGDNQKYKFSVPVVKYSKTQQVYQMSFSGLKTAVLYTINKIPLMCDKDKYDIAASFQRVIGKVFTVSLHKVLAKLQNNDTKITTVVAAGGVASNNYIRNELQNICTSQKLQFYAPPKYLCTDNAAMIAWAGLQRMQMDQKSNLKSTIRTKWSLENIPTQQE